MEDIIIIADDSEDISDKESTDNNSSITDKKPDSRKLSDDEIKEAENAVDYLCKLYKITISNETRKKIDTIENAKCIITAIAALRTSVAVNEAAAAKDLPESVSTAIFNLYTSNDELHKKINEASDTVNNLKNSNDDIRQIFETEIKNSFEREKQATNALIEQYRVSLEAKDKTYTLIMRSNNDLKKENEKLKGEMNTLQIENDKLKAMNALQAGTAQNQQPAAQQTINQNNGNKGISLFTKMKNHRNKNQQNNHNMDIFISDILSNNKFTKEQIEEVLKTLCETDDYGEILRAKGMVADVNGSWIYFDMVPEETEIREGAPEYTGRLCVIGSKLDEHALEELFGIA